MSSEIHKGPLESAPAPLPGRRSWREKRWERRRQRQRVEELLGWILVPIILVAFYWLVKVVLMFFGTSPSAVLQAIGTLVSGH